MCFFLDTYSSSTFALTFFFSGRYLSQRVYGFFARMCVESRSIVETIRIRPIVFALHNRLKHTVDMLLLRGFDEMLSYNMFCHVLADDCPGLNRTSEQISDDERLKQERSAFIREQLKELRRNHCLLPDIWDIVRSYWTSFS